MSLAAARATLRKLRTHDVIATMRARGERLIDGVRERITRHGVDSFLSISGQPAWSFLIMKDTPHATQWQTKTLFMQEIFERGILAFGTHNISFAHSVADIDQLLAVYDEVFPILRAGAIDGRIDELLRCKPLVPLFRLR